MLLIFFRPGSIYKWSFMFFKEKECLRISTCIPVKNVESFLRLLNLHRHQRSTHISNSFRCQKCRKCFKRQDIYLLQYTKKRFKENKFEPIWQQMHIYADDIHTVAHLNDVCYISLVYIAYTNNAAIMICFSLSVCITKKIMRVRLMFSFLCGSSKDPGICRGSFSFQIPGNRSLRAPEIQESKIDENFDYFRVCILKWHGHN